MKSEILPIGTVLHCDNDGFLINQSSTNKIGMSWKLAVDEIVKKYTETLSDEVHSMYVRGSVSRGTAIPHASDVDILVITNSRVADLDLSWKSEFKHKLNHDYTFSDGFDIDEQYIGNVQENRNLEARFIIKCLSACVFGQDLASSIRPFRPGPDTITVANWFTAKHLEHKLEELKNNTDIDVANYSKWLCKHLLRLGFELVMERDQSYTRDLYTCYKIFSEYYPEHHDDMKLVLELAINQTTNRQLLIYTLERFGGWLVQEAMRLYPTNS